MQNKKFIALIIFMSLMLPLNPCFAGENTDKDTSLTPKKLFEKLINKEEVPEEEKPYVHDFSQELQEEPQKLSIDWKFWKKFPTKKNKKAKELEEAQEDKSNIELSSDEIEYFPEKYEVVAKGNSEVFLQSSNTILKADKIIFNTSTNVIKGVGKVKIIKQDQVIDGDFVQINMNEENSLLEHPITGTAFIKIKAKMGYMYPGKLEVFDGTAKMKKNMDITLVGSSIGNYYDPTRDVVERRKYQKGDDPNQRYRIKSNLIVVNSKEDHDEIYIKDADLYIRNTKVMPIKNAQISSDKDHTFVETNLPEIGTLRGFGTYVGPGFLFNVPTGATLKVAPVAQIYNGHFGVGALGRFRSETNVTEAAWGTVENRVVVRGEQKLWKDFSLQYAKDSYIDEGFMGFRIPGYVIQLTHDKTFYIKDLDLTYKNNLSAGFVADYKENWHDYANSTARFRWQTETSKSFISRYTDDLSMGYDLGLLGQTSVAVYGTGDVQGVFRIGPYFKTVYKPWTQVISYTMAATTGDSPLLYDKYMYGKANLTIMESLRICKYLSIAYYGSFALMKDNWENKMLQENRFNLVFGPEDMKLAIGYDPIRSRSYVDFILTLGQKGQELEYKKMVINNPDTLGKSKKKKKVVKAELKAPEDVENEKFKKEDKSLEDAMDEREIKQDMQPILSPLQQMLRPPGSY